MQYRSEKIKQRFIECSDKGELFLSDECEILQHLFNKLHFVPLAEAAKLEGISYNGMKKKAQEGRVMSLKVGRDVFVSVQTTGTDT